MRSITIVVTVTDDRSGLTGESSVRTRRVVDKSLPPLGTQLAAALLGHLDDELKRLEEDNEKG